MSVSETVAEREGLTNLVSGPSVLDDARVVDSLLSGRSKPQTTRGQIGVTEQMLDECVVERQFVIDNKLGLHARAATRFVQVANRFASTVEIVRDDRCVDGKSIMGVLMLVADRGTRVIVRVQGDDAQAAMEAIAALIENKFDEE